MVTQNVSQNAKCVPKWQQLHVARAMHEPNSDVSTPLRWIFKTALYKRLQLQSLIQKHMQHKHSESAWEQRIALYKSNQ